MKKFYLILAALVAAMTVNAADWFLVCADFGWTENAKYKFTPKADNPDEQTLSVASVSGPIKIKEKDTWSTSFGTNGSNLKVGVPYAAGINSGDITVDGTIEDATITINTANHTVLITGAASENEYTDIYLVGDFGSGWNEAITTYPLKLVEGTTNTYEGKYNLTAATSYFKMKAGTLVYGTGGQDIAVELGKSRTAAQSGSAFSIGEGEFTFKFVLDKNAATGELTVTGEQIVTFPETMNVIGHVNGNTEDFAPNNVVAMTNDGDGIFTVSNIAISGAQGSTFGYFSFCVNPGTNATDWNIGKRYGATEKDAVPSFDAANPIVQNADPAAFKVEEGEYNMTLDLAKMTLVIETVGDVTAIDAIEVEAAANVDVVTVLGVVVRHNVPAAEATQGLPAGLYIVGGQKVLVK